jgi:hypothetical protein
MRWWRRLRQAWRSLPEQEVNVPGPATAHVAARALLAGLLLLGLLAIVSRLMENPTVRSQLESYVRQGVRGGAAALRDDLLATHKPGSPIGGVVSQVTRMGFQCGNIDPAVTLECRFRAKRPQDGQVATIILLLAHDGASLAGLETSMRVDPR